MPAISAAAGAFTQSPARDGRSRRQGGDPFSTRLAGAAAQIDAAREALRRDWRELGALAEAGQGIPLGPRVRTRFDAGNAVARGVHAVDRLFEASGGRAIFLDNPIQRVFRDVHAMRAHAFNNPDRAARLFGRFELALDKSDAGDLFV